eukprot:Skav213507  [mRNA]  locus=scaffold656:13431:16169:+ [translate_table: standard]
MFAQFLIHPVLSCFLQPFGSLETGYLGDGQMSNDGAYTSKRSPGSGHPNGSDLAAKESRSPASLQQESQYVLEQENRRLSEEIRTRTPRASTLDMERLQREAASLREQIQEEQRRRQSRVSDLQEQLHRLEGQNRQLRAQLSQAQLQNTSKVSDATALKREVVAKTMELEKLAREFQQSQSDLFSRVHSVSDSLLKMSRDNVRDQAQSQKFSTTGGSLPRASQNGNGRNEWNGEPAASASPEVGVPSSKFVPLQPSLSQFASLSVDDDTLQALKSRLQSLGDVLVFTSDKFDACCASGHSIPPGAVRVRPRRCDHVFLVECLMPYWVEGLCPVCRCSFAYSRENDESDKCSSVSTSVSQRFRRDASRGEGFEGETLRGPLGPLGPLGPVSSNPSGRGPKVLRVHRNTSHGARSDTSDRGWGGDGRDGRLRSPSRSATGVSGSLSRTSSGRDRPL